MKLDGVKEAYYYSRLPYMQILFLLHMRSSNQKMGWALCRSHPNFTYNILSWLHDESVKTKA